MELKDRNGLKVKIAVRYREMLIRINAEIDPLKLQDIRPDHLNRLYAKLAQPRQKKLQALAYLRKRSSNITG